MWKRFCALISIFDLNRPDVCLLYLLRYGGLDSFITDDFEHICSARGSNNDRLSWHLIKQAVLNFLPVPQTVLLSIIHLLTSLAALAVSLEWLLRNKP